MLQQDVFRRYYRVLKVCLATSQDVSCLKPTHQLSGLKHVPKCGDHVQPATLRDSRDTTAALHGGAIRAWITSVLHKATPVFKIKTLHAVSLPLPHLFQSKIAQDQLPDLNLELLSSL